MAIRSRAMLTYAIIKFIAYSLWCFLGLRLLKVWLASSALAGVFARQATRAKRFKKLDETHEPFDRMRRLLPRQRSPRIFARSGNMKLSVGRVVGVALAGALLLVVVTCDPGPTKRPPSSDPVERIASTPGTGQNTTLVWFAEGRGSQTVRQLFISTTGTITLRVGGDKPAPETHVVRAISVEDYKRVYQALSELSMASRTLPHEHVGPDVLTQLVGWMDESHQFPVSKVPEDFKRVIDAIEASWKGSLEAPGIGSGSR